MKIKEIISQNRRNFTAIYECEHCGFTKKGEGYDDDNFHQNVIPNMECPEMSKDKVNFKLHIDGAEDWSWADIVPNHIHDVSQKGDEK